MNFFEFYCVFWISFKGLPGYNCVKLYSKVLIDKYFLKNFSNSSLRLTT